jgi:hypothetical protein
MMPAKESPRRALRRRYDERSSEHGAERSVSKKHARWVAWRLTGANQGATAQSPFGRRYARGAVRYGANYSVYLHIIVYKLHLNTVPL